MFLLSLKLKKSKRIFSIKKKIIFQDNKYILDMINDKKNFDLSKNIFILILGQPTNKNDDYLDLKEIFEKIKDLQKKKLF